MHCIADMHRYKAAAKCVDLWACCSQQGPLHVIVAECVSLCVFTLCQSGVEGGITQEQLLNNFRDDVWSNTCVMLLRFITSAEIKRRADHFEPFVLVGPGGGGCQGHRAVQEWCCKQPPTDKVQSTSGWVTLTTPLPTFV